VLEHAASFVMWPGTGQNAGRPSTGESGGGWARPVGECRLGCGVKPAWRTVSGQCVLLAETREDLYGGYAQRYVQSSA
jgi:hypothetical protein